MTIGILIVVFLLKCFTLCCFLIMRWHRGYCIRKNLEELPEPPTVPFLGHILDLIKHKDIFNLFTMYHQNHGNIVKLFIGGIPSMLLINDSNLVKYITSSNFHVRKSEHYGCFSNALGKGLLLSQDDAVKYMYHKTRLNVMFRTRKLATFDDVFRSSTNRLLKRLQVEVSKPKVDIYQLIELCCIDIVTENSIGLSVNAQENKNSEFVKSLRRISKICTQRIHNPLLWYTLFYSFTYKSLEEWRANRFIKNFVNHAIRYRKRNRPKESETFLDRLLKMKTKQTQIRDDLITFIYKGYGTIASAISFALYLLAKYPKVQEETVTELKELFRNNKTRPIVLDELNDARYLEAVVKETLRLYPSFPLYARQVRYGFSYGDSLISKGLTLIINAFGIHRRPDLFEQPCKFCPERFRKGPDSDIYENYFPFSWGIRRCVGERYAMLVIKYVLVAILREYTVLPINRSYKPHVIYEPFLKSSNGIFVRLEARQFEDPDTSSDTG